MKHWNEEERQRILASSPIGTFTLMAIVVGAMVIGWLSMYFWLFLPRGFVG
jgi:hypothetical protein